MPFITRFQIQRLTDLNRTEWLMNADQWSTDENDAEEFRTLGKAQRRADRVGGEVCAYQRLANAFEALTMRRPTQIHLEAAE